jgi:hypothetical protein
MGEKQAKGKRLQVKAIRVRMAFVFSGEPAKADVMRPYAFCAGSSRTIRPGV